MNKLYLKTTLLFLLLLIVGLFMNLLVLKEHEKSLYYASNKIISGVLDKYPYLKDDLIEIINSNKDYKEVLKDYGFDSYYQLSYLTESYTYRNNIITLNIVYLIIVIITIYLFITYNNLKLDYEIHKINKYMNKVLNDNYSIDIRDYKETKLGLLKNDIYKLVVRLKQQSLSETKDKIYLKEFLSDISHQIKTPLTGMYVINDILEKEKDPIKRKEFLNKNKAQLERIEWLITSLLKMSLLESGTTSLNKTEVNIYKLINISFEPININLELKNIKVNISGDKNINYNLDESWIREVLLNILKNAYEYTPDGGVININYELNPLFLSIDITDNGIGMNKEEVRSVFKRFYKVDSDNNGLGIGLNMAKKIVKMHDGDIFVKSKKNEGTTFTIKIYNKND